jgi:hypothetical protein
LSHVYVPRSLTTAETFLWYDAAPGLKLGLAYLHKQSAFRFLGSYMISPETDTLPSIHVGFGVQGIGTGNPGYNARMEKNWQTDFGSINVFGGIGFRSNEDHAHPLGGFKIGLTSGWTAGLQWDGHDDYPFLTYTWDRYTSGVYLFEGRQLGYMFGARF